MRKLLVLFVAATCEVAISGARSLDVALSGISPAVEVPRDSVAGTSVVTGRVIAADDGCATSGDDGVEEVTDSPVGEYLIVAQTSGGYPTRDYPPPAHVEDTTRQKPRTPAKPVRDVYERQPTVAAVSTQHPWIDFDLMDMRFGYPGIVSGNGLKLCFGLPPPWGFGIGTSVVSIGGVSDASINYLGLLPLDLYYTPMIRWDAQNKPMPAIYGYLSYNSWLASSMSDEGGAGWYVKAGAGIEWEIWKGGQATYVPTYGVSPCVACATYVIMLLPGTVGFELGGETAHWQGLAPEGSFYADLKMSFGWHWRKLGAKKQSGS
jgi:hypothetical protein